MSSETSVNDSTSVNPVDDFEKPPTLKRKSNFKESRPPKIRTSDSRQGLSDSFFEETDYYFDNYLRKVYPYYFTYTTHCKGRWLGKRLVDVFRDEFRAHSKEDYEKSIAAGNIKVNGKQITSDYVLKDNDCVTNRTHRHEIAVVASPIKIVHQDDHFVVVDKPPSIPCHPCGRYRHNSLIFILAKEHNLKQLYSVHRLDKLTSGLLIFTKTIKKSQEINEQIRERKVEKEYVCRVAGDFPDGLVLCKEPIDVISPKMGICAVDPSGKPCETIFEKMSYNGHTSVVRCRPKTGRMHQIRVHLQFLGYPIMNDPIYNHEHAFGPLKGKNGDMGKSKEKLLEDLLQTHSLHRWLLEDGVGSSRLAEVESKDSFEDNENKVALFALDHYIKAKGFENLAEKYVKESEKFTSESTCDLCHQRYMDPEPKDLILFLHCLKYRGENWEFETDLPMWAKDDWSDTYNLE